MTGPESPISCIYMHDNIPLEWTAGPWPLDWTDGVANASSFGPTTQIFSRVLTVRHASYKAQALIIGLVKSCRAMLASSKPPSAWSTKGRHNHTSSSLFLRSASIKFSKPKKDRTHTENLSPTKQYATSRYMVEPRRHCGGIVRQQCWHRDCPRLPAIRFRSRGGGTRS